MEAASFDEANTILNAPEDLEENCSPLNVYCGDAEDQTPVVISCWKLTKDEIDELLRTGRLWLIIYGTNMPPVALTTNKPWRV